MFILIISHPASSWTRGGTYPRRRPQGGRGAFEFTVRSVFIISNRKHSNWASQILKANTLLICPYCLKFQFARVYAAKTNMKFWKLTVKHRLSKEMSKETYAAVCSSVKGMYAAVCKGMSEEMYSRQNRLSKEMYAAVCMQEFKAPGSFGAPKIGFWGLRGHRGAFTINPKP